MHTEIRATNVTWHEGHVARTDRETLLKQRGATLWFAVGLGGVFALLRMPSGLTSAKMRAFHASSSETTESDPMVWALPGSTTATKSSFHQRGFEVGATFIAQAFAAGFVASQLSSIFGNIGAAIGAAFGGPPISGDPPTDLSKATFSNDHQTALENIFFYLQRQP